jgi:hypothetical protein
MSTPMRGRTRSPNGSACEEPPMKIAPACVVKPGRYRLSNPSRTVRTRPLRGSTTTTRATGLPAPVAGLNVMRWARIVGDGVRSVASASPAQTPAATRAMPSPACWLAPPPWPHASRERTRRAEAVNGLQF